MEQYEYFQWMASMVRAPKKYSKLLNLLNNIPFRFIEPLDRNREQDGIDLRYTFCCDVGIQHTLIDTKPPCSVLEMMVALAKNCEDKIMYDQRYGDRTDDWFWYMVDSLGLTRFDDRHFNEDIVSEKISIFLNRQYSADGHGGLFTIPNSPIPLNKTEIWTQLCWWLDSMGY